MRRERMRIYEKKWVIKRDDDDDDVVGYENVEEEIGYDYVRTLPYHPTIRVYPSHHSFSLFHQHLPHLQHRPTIQTPSVSAVSIELDIPLMILSLASS